MEGNTASYGSDPKHLVAFGPFKKHVLEVVRPLMILDIGHTLNLVMAVMLAPNFTRLFALLTMLGPAILTLLAVKNGNKNYALVPLIFSVVFFTLWTIFIGLCLLMIPDFFKVIKENVVEFPLAAGINSPFLRSLCMAAFLAFVEAFIYYNLKVHYTLWRYLKEQETAKKEVTHQPFNQPFNPAGATAAYQGAYQGYDTPQPQLVKGNVY